MIKSRKNQVAILTILLIIIISASIFYFTQPSKQVDNSQEIDKVNIVADLAVLDHEFYKGQSLQAILSISSNKSIEVLSIKLTVNDTMYSRVASKTITIAQSLSPGSHNISLSLPIVFDEDGFLVLATREYTISSLLVNYKAGKVWTYSKDLTITILGKSYPVFDQFASRSWTVDNNDSVIATIENGHIVAASNQDNSSLQISTLLQTTAYAYIQFSYKIVNASIQISIADLGISITGNEDNNTKLPVGNLQGNYKLEVSMSLNASSSVQLNISMPTRKVVIFSVIANNHWNGTGNDGLVFNEPEYYIEQASYRFSNTINITILPVKTIYFEYKGTTDLSDLRTEAIKEVGKQLHLPQNWYVYDGTYPQNAGLDILLIMTNKTMDHLGEVLRINDRNVNVAIHARGTLFTGNYRLISSFADNLVQHEISHIFQVRDRWTYKDPASIMTKSMPEDAAYDILIGQFWLFQTKWLEEDIQIMASNIDSYVQ